MFIVSGLGAGAPWYAFPRRSMGTRKEGGGGFFSRCTAAIGDGTRNETIRLDSYVPFPTRKKGTAPSALEDSLR